MKDAVDLLNQRIAELEAEHRDCLQTITDMQSKWRGELQNDVLRDYAVILSTNRLSSSFYVAIDAAMEGMNSTNCTF